MFAIPHRGPLGPYLNLFPTPEASGGLGPFLALYVVGAGYMGGMSVRNGWDRMRDIRRRRPDSPELAAALPRGD